MALHQHPSPAFFSLLVAQKPSARANFPLTALPEKPQVICLLPKHHRLTVCQHSPPDRFNSASLESPPIVGRRSNYNPPKWDDHFLESLNGNPLRYEAFNKKRSEELKEEVKNLLISTNDSLQKMELVDAIERLGLAYHFEEEIQSTLQQVYEANDDYGDKLYVVALRFLLLRQHGYNVSCDVFEKFKDQEGNFKQSLRIDVKGLLSLYEASYCGIRGEDILDDSLTFTRKELKSVAGHLVPTLTRRVQHSLELPPQRGFRRLEVKQYISFYEDDESRNDVLLELSKMDFNLLQSLYQRGIKEVFSWWKEVDLGEKIFYARDIVVEAYVWVMALNSLPEFSNGRITLAKLNILMGVLDDMYDTYGTLDELELFTNAMIRWDIEALDQLPENLKAVYLVAYNLINDTQYMSKKHRENNSICYIKKKFQDFCEAYMQEARWFHDGYTPSMDEYLNISLTTAGGFLFPLVAAISMGDLIDKEGLDYIVGDSKLPKLVSTITRLLDDIATFKDEQEQEQDDVAKSIKCYIEEHGVSEEEACTHIENLVAEAWKDINHELLSPIPLPKEVVSGIINHGKITEVFFMNGNDGFGNSQCWFKDLINSMLFEPIPM